MSPLRVLALALVLPVAVPAQQPTVLKVEPPNWWAGHSINPVRLLVHGVNLAGASVEAPHGFRASGVKVNAAGTYLFVDLEIPRKAKSGKYPLLLKSRKGSAEIPFEIEKALPKDRYFQGFNENDVIYLLMLDRFADGDQSNDDPEISHGLFDRKKARYYHGGDLQGVIDHLPYLKDLGVTAIWMTPIYDNNNHLNEKETYGGQAITDYHGYGAIDYYRLDEHFGTVDTLRKLVNEAHRYGIKVIQDQVENHIGPYNPWVHDPPTPTWLHGSEASHINESWQVWTVPDPSASESLRKQVLNGWFLNLLPDMNQDDPEVARYEVQNTLWWLGTAGFDGVRQDTWPYVPRTFWRTWMSAIKHEYPRVDVVGEVFDPDPALVSFFEGGRTQYDGVDDMVDSVFDFPSFFKLREAFAQGEALRELAKMVGHDYLYPDPNRLVTFLGLHDVQRFMNEPGATVDGLKLAFTYLLTARGIPMIYYGDEIAMHGGNDPDNRRDFPGGWPGDPHNAFTAAKRTPEQQDVFAYVRELTGLRQKLECLRRGRMLSLVTDEQVWAYARITKKQTAVVVLNNGKGPGTARITLADLGMPELARWSPQLGPAGPPVIRNGQARITLPPRTAEIYQVEGLP